MKDIGAKKEHIKSTLGIISVHKKTLL